MEFPDDENGDVLRRMQESGDDLSKPRDIDFTVVFPDEAAARAFVGQLHGRDCRVTVERTGTAEGLPWDVLVVKNMVPSHEAITEYEALLESFASQHGGRNDGWGCLSLG